MSSLRINWSSLYQSCHLLEIGGSIRCSREICAQILAWFQFVYRWVAVYVKQLQKATYNFIISSWCRRKKQFFKCLLQLSVFVHWTGGIVVLKQQHGKSARIRKTSRNLSVRQSYWQNIEKKTEQSKPILDFFELYQLFRLVLTQQNVKSMPRKAEFTTTLKTGKV